MSGRQRQAKRIDYFAIMETKPSFISPSLKAQIILASLCRLFLNTSRRFAYPFAPELSRGLNVPLTSVSSLIAANQLTGVLSLFFGPIGDKWGYRVMLLSSMTLMSLGMLFGGSWPIFGTILVAQFLAGLGKSIFDPALQAFVSQRVPFHKRGFIIGLMEIVWALTTLVAIPCVGLLIGGFGWRSPYFVMGFLGLVMVAVLWRLIPDNQHSGNEPKSGLTLRQGWQLLRTEPAALGMIIFSFWMAVANDNLFVVYGVWFEQAFALKVVAIGLSTTVIGSAELLGELLTASLSDRLGMRRSILIGLVCVTLGYLLMPFLSINLPIALVMLFFTFLGFEFSIVSSMALSTEILRDARATMMAANLAAAGCGRVCGTYLGSHLWIFGGIKAVGLFSALCCGLAFVSLLLGLRGFAKHTIHADSN
jgi:predicted MFS family arabinose efflux permease